MTYPQTLSYLYSQLPMFHRIGAAAYKADLGNTIKLCSLLGNPEKEFPAVHIAGTNGKGSTSHFIASVLQEAGYKTGLFTSPHLKDFRERIKINGRMIPKKDVTTFVALHRKEFEAVQPSFFEWTFALAAWHFAKEKVDIAVIETGMGGRLDSTNVVNPLLCVITNIGMDHMQFLGNSLQEIASEKAGIIKPGVPLIVGETNPETDTVFINFAEILKTDIVFADQHVQLRQSNSTKHPAPLLRAGFLSKASGQVYNLTSPLSGKYQLKNLATVICSIEKLQQNWQGIQKKHITSGIRRVIKNTGLLGRWQTIAQNPLTIADIGHNPDGLREVLEQINLTPHKKLHFVIGVVNDKDIQTMLAKLPVDAVYYFCKADIPRGMDTGELAREAGSFSLSGNVYPSVSEALKSARQVAGQGDLVIVGGSAFVVAEVV